MGTLKKARRNMSSILTVAGIVFVLLLLFGSNMLDILKLEQQKMAINAQIQETKAESSQLDEDIAQIGSQNYIENLARRYLHMYYPNEQIVVPVKLKTGSASSSAAAQTTANTAPADQAATDQTTTDQTAADQTTADQKATEQTTADQAAADQAAADETAADQTTTDQTAAN